MITVCRNPYLKCVICDYKPSCGKEDLPFLVRKVKVVKDDYWDYIIYIPEMKNNILKGDR